MQKDKRMKKVILIRLLDGNFLKSFKVLFYI